mgnify:CR=1 FL=1
MKGQSLLFCFFNAIWMILLLKNFEDLHKCSKFAKER